MKYMLFSILCIFLISSASALVITPSYMDGNKTIGQPQLINFQVLNNQNMTMYNITFQDSTVLDLPKISSLDPGQTVNVTANIVREIQGVYNLNLQGFYYTNIGTSSNTYQVNISSSLVNDCDKTIIFGDTIRWYSSVIDPIVIYNSQTGVPLDGGTINSNQSFASNLPVGSFQYYAKRNGFTFTPTCTITVLNTTGLINNPQYDGHLQLNLQVYSPPTTISNSILTTSYTMDFSDTNDGVMSVTNTGSNIANVNLKGEWFIFNSPSFNLNPGQTKGITYTISPVVLTTSDTNKTYSKSINLSGNFVTQIIPISIKINYADLSGNFSSLGNASIDDYLKNSFCPRFPQYCQNPVIYKYLQNGTGQTVSVNTTQEALDGAIKASYDTKDAVNTKVNEIGSMLNELQSNFSKLDSQLNGINETYVQKVNEDINFKNNIIWIMGFITMCLAGVVGWFWYLKLKKDKNLEEKSRY